VTVCFKFQVVVLTARNVLRKVRANATVAAVTADSLWTPRTPADVGYTNVYRTVHVVCLTIA